MTDQDDGSKLVNASIWMRIGLVSYREAVMGEEVEERLQRFKDRNFIKARIEETPHLGFPPRAP